MPTLTKKVWTDEALMSLPESEGKFELLDGDLISMSPAGYDHSHITVKIVMALGYFVASHKLGKVLESNAGFRLDPDNVLSPDVSFVSRERDRDSGTPAGGFFRGVPELAVEVISPSERRGAIRLKIEKYFAYGTRLVWLVHPRRKCVDVYTSPDAMITIETGELDGGDVLPGFRLPLDTIFEDWF